MRSFIRHPTEMPIDVLFDDQATGESLRNVSRGGLSFRYRTALPTGARLRVRIPVAAPVFEAACRVSWCQPDGEAWQVGVEFVDSGDLFRARMVEQICRIEQYRCEMRDQHGRSLSGQEAALEWIARYASEFPSVEDDASPPDGSASKPV